MPLMTFKKQNRYVIRRKHEQSQRFIYLNHAGQETELPSAFGAKWTNGEPARMTLHNAILMREDANNELGPWLPLDGPEFLWRCELFNNDLSWN